MNLLTRIMLFPKNNFSVMQTHTIQTTCVVETINLITKISYDDNIIVVLIEMDCCIHLYRVDQKGLTVFKMVSLSN